METFVEAFVGTARDAVGHPRQGCAGRVVITGRSAAAADADGLVIRQGQGKLERYLSTPDVISGEGEQ